jgi:hypothetical protein
MAFAASMQQTVLWDQIEYSGNPADFSWVLPVRSGTVVQASSDAWFAALDAATSPTITGPTRPCNGVGGGCASSAASGFAASAESASGGEVQVVSQTVVGPYDAATLKATDPNALETWLGANGYTLPASFQPTIAAYVIGGFDFIALRLRRGLGVQAMQPVRVVTQGADTSLPLRMVAAGVGAQVEITLYVVSEGRYEAAPPFANATINDSQLFWYHAQNRSNYQELSLSIMAGNGGRTWLTEFSGPANLVPSGQQGCGQIGASYYGQSVADLYLGQCPCPVSPIASDASLLQGDALGDFFEAAADGAGSFDSAPDDAPEGAASEASVPATAPTCTGDDLDVALVGLHAADVWVTRLRAILPANALAERDLTIQATTPQTPVTSAHTASTYDDPTYSPCGTHDSGCAASATGSRDEGAYAGGGALLVAFAAGLRRAKRKRGAEKA